MVNGVWEANRVALDKALDTSIQNQHTSLGFVLLFIHLHVRREVGSESISK
jgi:hypothetical protein